MGLDEYFRRADVLSGNGLLYHVFPTILSDYGYVDHITSLPSQSVPFGVEVVFLDFSISILITVYISGSMTHCFRWVDLSGFGLHYPSGTRGIRRFYSTR